jgi:glycosyltransferase involved in cell wall biosynthesis
MGVTVNLRAERSSRSDDDRINILFLGRLVEKKGVHYLLTAFADICHSYTNVTLTIAGDGPWSQRLHQQAEDLDILGEQAVFVGHVSGDKKTNIINDADIFVVPSIITDEGDAEGLPVVLLEGLAASKICIATNESGADDIIEDGINGFLISQKSVAELEAAISKSLQLIMGERHNEIQDNARSTASRFAWPEIAQQHYKALFEDNTL